MLWISWLYINLYSLPQIIIQRIYIGIVKANNCPQESLFVDFFMIRIIHFLILKISILRGEFPKKIIPYVIIECTYK